jgi:hypothetical protein
LLLARLIDLLVVLLCGGRPVIESKLAGQKKKNIFSKKEGKKM